MQGQKGTIGSFPETLSFDSGSTSNSTVDQQICWNNVRNPPENRLAEYMLPPAGTTMTYVNSIGHERQQSHSWSFGEPSSHASQNDIICDDRKTQHGWSSLSPCAGAGLRLEEQQCEPSSSMSVHSVNVNPLFVQSSNSSVMSQNLNLNAGIVSHDDDDCQGGCPNSYKAGASDNVRTAPSGVSETFVLPSGSVGYVAEENDCRPGCSFERRRASCKRKALEANVDQSSVSGSSSYFQRAESGAWPSFSAHCDGGCRSSISAPSEQVNSGLGLRARAPVPDHVPDSYVPGNAENTRRNFCMRINPSVRQEPMPPALFPTGPSVRHTSVSSAHQSSRHLQNDQSLNSRTATVAGNTSSQTQPVLLHVPVLPRNVQPSRWDIGSSSRTGGSSSANVSRDRDAFPYEEVRPRIMGRSVLEHPIVPAPAPDLRHLVQNPANRSSVGRNITGNSTLSLAGSSTGVNPSSAPAWVPHPNPPIHYLRRFSELFRRSLISSLGSESGGQSTSQIPLHSDPPSAEEMMHSRGVGNQRHHQSYPRSASWLERQGDGVLGFPHPLRGLAASGDGRSRIVVSEIRNVLDLMRRGESLRFEDVMILDQSIFFGVADIHDQHRDMRLDVDNMSYEELLALEERIGNVSTGLSEETITNRLKQRKYSNPTRLQQEVEPCCVCQEEYNDGEDVGTLDCGHDFHTPCIKQWLMHKNLCPVCKTTALSTS